MIDDKAIERTLRTGKVSLGGNNAIKAARVGRAKLIIIAANCLQTIRESIVYYSKLSKIPVIIYNGNSIDLGVVCRKPFTVSALTIRDPGDSDILKLTETTNV